VNGNQAAWQDVLALPVTYAQVHVNRDYNASVAVDMLRNAIVISTNKVKKQ
jgi:hypothetical protein